MSESEHYFEQVTDYRFLLVRAGGRTVAIPLHTVTKVCDPLPVTRLPCVDAAVDGLVNLEGKPVLQVNVCRKLFRGQTSATGKLVVVESATYHVALAVEDLAGESDVLPEDVQQLDTASLASIALERTDILAESSSLAQLVETKASEDMQPCLVYEYAGETYGFRLEHIVEVLFALPVTPIAGAPETVAGIVTVRGQTRLLLGDCKIPGLTYQREHTLAMMIIQCHGQLYMIPVCANLEMKMLLVDKCQQEHVRDESGRLVRLLLPDDIIDSAAQESLKSFMPVETTVQQQHQITKPYLVAVIARQPYALSFDKVLRVLPSIACQRLLDSAHRVTGLLDLDGRVTPVFNIHHWLGLEQPEGVSPRHVVIEHRSRVWTMPVDEVSALIELGDGEIDRVEKPDGCFDGFCRDGERVLPLLAVERIYESLL